MTPECCRGGLVVADRVLLALTDSGAAIGERRYLARLGVHNEHLYAHSGRTRLDDLYVDRSAVGDTSGRA